MSLKNRQKIADVKYKLGEAAASGDAKNITKGLSMMLKLNAGKDFGLIADEGGIYAAVGFKDLDRKAQQALKKIGWQEDQWGGVMYYTGT